MKFKIYRIFLYLFFSVAVGFSFQIEAFAHEYRGQVHGPELNINAENVDVGDEEFHRENDSSPGRAHCPDSGRPKP